jgi:hypothetical protein
MQFLASNLVPFSLTLTGTFLCCRCFFMKMFCSCYHWQRDRHISLIQHPSIFMIRLCHVCAILTLIMQLTVSYQLRPHHCFIYYWCPLGQTTPLPLYEETFNKACGIRLLDTSTVSQLPAVLTSIEPVSNVNGGHEHTNQAVRVVQWKDQAPLTSEGPVRIPVKPVRSSCDREVIIILLSLRIIPTSATRWFTFCILRHRVMWVFPILLGKPSDEYDLTSF